LEIKSLAAKSSLKRASRLNNLQHFQTAGTSLYIRQTPYVKLCEFGKSATNPMTKCQKEGSETEWKWAFIKNA
jgi:hypothetical protein